MVIQQKTIGRALATAGLIFIAAMTLVPHPELTEQANATPVWCLVCGDLGLEDVILNIILFLPLGFGLRLAGLSRRQAFGIAFLTTFTVESLQFSLIAGRDASLSDVLTNSTGGWLGIMLAERWREVVLPAPALSRRLALLGAVIWLGIQTGSGFLIRISLPRTVYFAQWAPELGQFDQFRGRVLRARLNDKNLPGWRLTNTEEVRQSLSRDSFALEVTAIGDDANAGLAPILSIFDDQQQEILLLGRWGRDLAFRVRTRAGASLLRNPGIRLTGVLPTTPGRLLDITAGLARGRLFLQLGKGENPQRREVALSPSWGWSLLLPYEYAFGPELYFLTALWIAGLLFPVAYWWCRGAETAWNRALGQLALVPGLGLAALPALSGLPAVHWSEWAAAAIGIGLGWGLGKVSGKR